MEMAEMGAPLKSPLNEDFSEAISMWIEHTLFDATEFQKILEKTNIPAQKKEIILKSVECEEVKTILKINLTSHLYNLVANATVISTGLVGLVQSNSWQEAIGKGLGTYLGKSLISPLVAYIGWWKKEITKKHKLAAWMLVPVAGDWLFLIRSLKVHHRQFLKFLVTYQETKRLFRKIIPDAPGDQWEDFDKILAASIEKRKSQSTSAQIVDLCVKNPIKNITTSTQEKVQRHIEKK